MDPEQAQESSERDQLWTSLRALRQEIDCLPERLRRRSRRADARRHGRETVFLKTYPPLARKHRER